MDSQYCPKCSKPDVHVRRNGTKVCGNCGWRYIPDTETTQSGIGEY